MTDAIPTRAANEGRVAKVVRLAEEWWLSQRPVGWTEDKHLGNPTVNTSSDPEWFLAQAVAGMVAERNHIERLTRG